MKPLLALVLLACAILTWAVHCSITFAGETKTSIAAHIEQILSSPATSRQYTKQYNWLQNTYRLRTMRPLWVSDETTGTRGTALLKALRQTEKNGIPLDDLQPGRLDSLLNSQAPHDLATLDILLSAAFFSYIQQSGILSVNSPTQENRMADDSTPVSLLPPHLLETALSTPDLEGFLTSLLPQQPSYRHLTKALAQYQNMADNAKWKIVEPGKSIRPGEQSLRIPAIRERLIQEGFFSGEKSDSLFFDDHLASAVKLFQYRHTLEPDGIIGKSTIAAMNITAADKVQRIRNTLARMRMLPRDQRGISILINIPSFTLVGMQNQEPSLTMAIVVGKPEHQTPEFQSRIRTVELNPYWNIPPKIAREEILAELRKNPHYLNAHHIRLYSERPSVANELNPLSINWHHTSPERMNQYRLRQEPGKWNALGFIKFSFPNRHGIYMHDTPSRSHFQRANRAYSHGCIRLEKPADLALFLLQAVPSTTWTKERIEELTKSGRHVVIELPEPVPVVLSYLTVTSDITGAVFFHPDIYNREPLSSSVTDELSREALPDDAALSN